MRRATLDGCGMGLRGTAAGQRGQPWLLAGNVAGNVAAAGNAGRDGWANVKSPQAANLGAGGSGLRRA